MCLQSKIFTVVLLCGLPVFTAIANNYYPNGEDDHYTYTTSRDGVVTDEVIRRAGAWILHAEFGGLGQIYVYTRNNNTLTVYSNGNLSRLANFDDPVGTEYAVTLGVCNTGTSVIAEKQAELTVPAGTFTDVIRIDFRGNCADAGIVSQWYARDVGIIQWTEPNIAGLLATKLTKAIIADQAIPPPQVQTRGFAMQASIDRLSYSALSPSRPEILKFQLTLLNELASKENITLLFSSGQLFDAVIYDADNIEVTRWSHGRVFIQSTTTQIIKFGDTFTLTDELELVNQETAAMLAPGTYNIEIFFTTSLSPSTRLPFNIE